MLSHFSFFFFFNDTATTEIYTLSLHDALPILAVGGGRADTVGGRAVGHAILGRAVARVDTVERRLDLDRKSTRLNSSHANISYAVFCLKKKKKKKEYIKKKVHSKITQTVELTQ